MPTVRARAVSGLNEFKVQQIVDNGRTVQITLAENVHTEPISQRQIVMEKVAKRLDGDARSQIMPLLDIILQSQPQMKLRTYQHTTVTVSMPRNRYDRMGRPQVGQIMEIDMSVRPARRGLGGAAGNPFVRPARGGMVRDGTVVGADGALPPGPPPGRDGRPAAEAEAAAEGEEDAVPGKDGESPSGPPPGRDGRSAAESEEKENAALGKDGESPSGPPPGRDGRSAAESEEGEDGAPGKDGAPQC